MGDPSTVGHQCYRRLHMEYEHCFSDDDDDNNVLPSVDGCKGLSPELLQWRTVFYGIQPRYMNVDIRIVIDVTTGGNAFKLNCMTELEGM